MELILGIDDAGRGPVLGPMILAGVLIQKHQEPILKQWGAKDSKLLLPKKRAEIAGKIIKNFQTHIEVTSPQEIDEGKNLNWTEAIKAGKIINKLIENINEKVEVIVDCPSVNTKSWQEYLQKLVIKKNQVTLKCEHKADINHPVVSAASIIAKEKREELLRQLKKELEINFGSGYPSDPITKEFIKENHSNPKYKELIRKSWKTFKNAKAENEQRALF